MASAPATLDSFIPTLKDVERSQDVADYLKSTLDGLTAIANEKYETAQKLKPLAA